MLLAAAAVALACLPASSAAAAARQPRVRLVVASGPGVLLTHRGAWVRLRVIAMRGRRRVRVPGRLRFTSSAPRLVAVGGRGRVSARRDPAGALVRVSSTSAGVASASVTVVAAALKSGVISLAAGEVISVGASSLLLRRDATTAQARVGRVIVDAANEVVGRISGLVARGGTIAVSVVRVPPREAFSSLRIAIASRAPAAHVSIAGHTETVRDAAGRVVARASDAGIGFECDQAAGSSAQAVLTAPTASLVVQGDQVAEVLGLWPLRLRLQAGAAATGEISLGSVDVSAAGRAHIDCELKNLPDLSVPAPVDLLVASVDVTVDPSFEVSFTADAEGQVTVKAPTIRDEVSALEGLELIGGRWRPINEQSTSGPTVASPTISGDVSVSAEATLTARLDLGLEANSLGDRLAGINLAWLALNGKAAAGLASPFSYISAGYRGPTYTLTGGVSAGVEATLQDSELTELLSWIGAQPPDIEETLWEDQFLAIEQPTPKLISPPGSVQPGQRVELTASSPGAEGATVDFLLFPAGAPTGETIASAVISGETASASWTVPESLPAGSYRIVADVFSGAFGAIGLPFPSSGAPLTIIGAAPAGTSTEVTSTPDPALEGEPVTLKAQVAPDPGGGTVAFTANAASIAGCAAQPVSEAGQATCTTEFPSAGTYQVSAAYSGDARYSASTSSVLTQTVEAAAITSSPTTTQLKSSAATAGPGASVTFTASVRPAPNGGTVEFTDNGSAIPGCSTQPLEGSGEAVCRTSFASEGPHEITALYSGDTNYEPSRSSPLTLTVESSSSSSGWHWETGQIDSTRPLESVGCGAGVCVAGDQMGYVLDTTKPSSGSSAWSAATQLSTGTGSVGPIVAMSCPSAALCVGGSDVDSLVWSGEPAREPPIYALASVTIPDGQPGGGEVLTTSGISCVSSAFCLGVGTGGQVMWSQSPLASDAQGSTWTVIHATGQELSAADCPSSGLCVVGGTVGTLGVSSKPTGEPTAWTFFELGNGQVTGLDCLSSKLCLASTASGYIDWSIELAGGESDWSTAKIANEDLTSVACASESRCFASGYDGRIWSTATPTSGASWSSENVDSSTAINGLSCPTQTPVATCIGVDADGNVLTGTED